METHAHDSSSDRPGMPSDADADAMRADWAIAVLAVGLVGLVLLPRLRVAAVGFSRANPDRWAFLRTGAPWSVVALAVASAGLVVALFARQLGILEVAALAVGVALVVALLGPLADRAARQHLGRGLA